jgi:CubicO group peptidase (beta-lactamase class C family)
VFKRRGSRIGLFTLLIAASLAGGAAAAPGPLPAAVATKIDADVRAVLRRFAAPGAAVMVIQNGHVALVETFGTRDVERRLAVQPDTLFEIGSITKQLTAASILQLQEAGKLQIDRPLSDYLPDAPHAKEVTLRQLLTHTSGLHDYLDGPPEEIDPLASRPIAYRDLIARVASAPLDFPPGSQWSYSNTGYLLLGKVIETVSGETYKDYLQRHFLGPLQMRDTFTTGDEGRLANLAIGYRHVDGKLERAPIIDPSWGGAAGFLVAPLSDLAKWDEALRGGKVVSPGSYKQMTTPFTMTNGQSAGYGLALFVDSAYGQPRIGHTGGTNGSTAADEYFPQQDVRILAFTNLGDRSPEVGETLTNAIFADLYPAIAAAAQKPAPGEKLAVSQTVREAFRELQTGKDYARFGPRLREKLAGGAGGKFVSNLGPFGAPSGAIFKGVRSDATDSWYDYVMQFGPGVFLPFSAKIDPQGLVAGLSVG